LIASGCNHKVTICNGLINSRKIFGNNIIVQDNEIIKDKDENIELNKENSNQDILIEDLVNENQKLNEDIL